MIYLFLRFSLFLLLSLNSSLSHQSLSSHYAQENEKVALLAVNSLVKDSHDDSPMIRGLALRHLTSMRSAALIVYTRHGLFIESLGFLPWLNT